MTRTSFMKLKNRWLVIGFVLAAIVTLALGARLVTRAVYWATHQDLPIEGWMTVGYVARSHGLEPTDLISALGPPYTLGDRRPLVGIAEARGVSLNVMAAELETAIKRAREARP